jgi:hypothetical protein
MKFKLCEAQFHESIDTIQDQLHAKKHLLNCKDKNITGQYKSTQAHTLISQVSDHVTVRFEKYCCAKEALWALGGKSKFYAIFKQLKLAHLVLDGEELQPDVEASWWMNIAGGGTGPCAKKNGRTGKSKAQGKDVPLEGP